MGKNLNIRKLPDDLDQAIDKRVRLLQTTRTEVVVSALKVALGISQPRFKRDVRSFFGQMNHKQYQDFLNHTDGFQKIDKELWK